MLVIGARGSDQPSGLGKQVSSATDTLRSLLNGTGRTVRQQPVSYEAKAIPKTLLGWPSWFKGLNDGVDEAASWLQARRRECPGERLVLAGYSQGAMVMHRLTNRWLRNDNRGMLDRLDGVLLIADGDRVSNDHTATYGTASRSASGIGLQYPAALSGSATTRLPKQFNSLAHSVCNRNDPVCDSKGSLIEMAGLPVHYGYTDGRPLRQAVKAIVARIRARPHLTTKTVTGRVGEALRVRLSADIESGYSLEWRLLTPFKLPGGLTLTRSGDVSGTPVGVFSGTVPIQIRGTILGIHGDWVTEKLSLAITQAFNPATCLRPDNRLIAGDAPNLESIYLSTDGGGAKQIWGDVRNRSTISGQFSVFNVHIWPGTCFAPASTIHWTVGVAPNQLLTRVLMGPVSPREADVVTCVAVTLETGPNGQHSPFSNARCFAPDGGIAPTYLVDWEAMYQVVTQ